VGIRVVVIRAVVSDVVMSVFYSHVLQIFLQLWATAVVPKVVRAVTQVKVAIMSHYPQYFAS